MGAYNEQDFAIAGSIARTVQDRVSVTSKSAQNEISPGQPVMTYEGEEVKCYKYLIDTAKIVWDADFVTGNLIDITVNSVAVAQVTFTTDHDTTMGLIVAAVQATNITDAEGNTIALDAALDAGDANNRTLYIRGVGADINGNVTEAVTAGASQATGTITYQSDQVFLGGAVRSEAEPTGSPATLKYDVNDPVSVMEYGVAWMVVAAAVSSKTVNITTAGVFSSGAGDTTTGVFTTNSETNTTTSDVLSAVEFNGQTKLNAAIAWA